MGSNEISEEVVLFSLECKHDKHKTTFRARIKVTPGGHRLRTPRNFAPHQIDNMH